MVHYSFYLRRKKVPYLTLPDIIIFLVSVWLFIYVHLDSVYAYVYMYTYINIHVCSGILLLFYKLSHLKCMQQNLECCVSFFFFNCTLGSGVHVQIMQDCCVGTHMAMWVAVSILHCLHLAFLPIYPSLTSPPPCFPSLGLPNRPQCVILPSLCPCVLPVQHLPMSENMQYLIFCSSVSLLRMMVFIFIHVFTKDTNSSFFMAA